MQPLMFHSTVPSELATRASHQIIAPNAAHCTEFALVALLHTQLQFFCLLGSHLHHAGLVNGRVVDVVAVLVVVVDVVDVLAFEGQPRRVVHFAGNRIGDGGRRGCWHWSRRGRGYYRWEWDCGCCCCCCHCRFAGDGFIDRHELAEAVGRLILDQLDRNGSFEDGIVVVVRRVAYFDGVNLVRTHLSADVDFLGYIETFRRLLRLLLGRGDGDIIIVDLDAVERIKLFVSLLHFLEAPDGNNGIASSILLPGCQCTFGPRHHLRADVETKNFRLSVSEHPGTQQRLHLMERVSPGRVLGSLG